MIRANLLAGLLPHPQVKVNMRNFLPASILLVLPVALLVPMVGCGRVSNTSTLQPVDSSPSTVAAIAPGGLQLGYVWQKDSQNLYPVVGVTGSARLGDGVLPTNVPVAVAAAVQGPNASWAVALDQDGTLRELNLSTGLTSTLAAHIPLDSALVLSPAGSRETSSVSSWDEVRARFSERNTLNPDADTSKL